MLAACGSNAPHPSTAARTGAELTSAEANASGLGYARCMRSHGVARFPDPSAGGSIDTHVPGLNLSSPAAKSAETACQGLLPEKHPPAQQPTAKAYARLLAWAKCMRRHGISGLPDPRPDPVPGPGSAASSDFATVMGDGGYWVGIPVDDNAHSPAFMRTSTTCGESPTGPVHHHA
ncbi:MAG TPA: hypothetical protein VHU61_03685 [Solirubrobacteraceae bacterium]|nr:hypothetical protein [Solirubrobacteraceae bacterium]